MNDSEKIIEDIEYGILMAQATSTRLIHLSVDKAEEIVELLKKQKPRMMMLDEIKDGESYWLSAGKDFVPRPVICVHREDDARKPYITFAWQFGTFSFESEDYDKKWHCWTAKPTDNQIGGSGVR